MSSSKALCRAKHRQTHNKILVSCHQWDASVGAITEIIDAKSIRGNSGPNRSQGSRRWKNPVQLCDTLLSEA